MDLTRWPRESGIKDHQLFSETYFSSEAPGVIYELRPLQDLGGRAVDGLHAAWIILNNPRQYNSYTTEMVKGVIAAFNRASAERSVVAVVFTAVGDRAFCTGGNTKEYAEYYSANPSEYGTYVDLFIGMIDAILNCRKPVICRVNGMRVAGGQELGTACDLTISADTAVFGQAGPRHGSAPIGGITDFLPTFLPMDLAMWSAMSCELWSAYKMYRLGLVSKVVPVLKVNGRFIRNPLVITDRYVEDGDIVYGEFVQGEEAEKARKIVETAEVDFSLLDAEVNKMVWTIANLMPGCVAMTVDSLRQKKKFFWDANKAANRHWAAANMMSEAYLGFNAFNNRKLTGRDVIDFIRYRQLLAEAHVFDQELIDAVMPQPKGVK